MLFLIHWSSSYPFDLPVKIFPVKVELNLYQERGLRYTKILIRKRGTFFQIPANQPRMYVCKKNSGSPWSQSLSFGFFCFFFFFKKTCAVLICSVVRGREFCSSWGLQYPSNLFITQGPQLWGRTNFGPAQTRSHQGLPPVVNGISCWVRSKRKRRGLV